MSLTKTDVRSSDLSSSAGDKAWGQVKSAQPPALPGGRAPQAFHLSPTASLPPPYRAAVAPSPRRGQRKMSPSSKRRKEVGDGARPHVCARSHLFQMRERARTDVQPWDPRDLTPRAGPRLPLPLTRGVPRRENGARVRGAGKQEALLWQMARRGHVQTTGPKTLPKAQKLGIEIIQKKKKCFFNETESLSSFPRSKSINFASEVIFVRCA